jgi:hypothetical protein
MDSTDKSHPGYGLADLARPDDLRRTDCVDDHCATPAPRGGPSAEDPRGTPQMEIPLQRWPPTRRSMPRVTSMQMLKPADLAPRGSMELMTSYRVIDHQLLYRDRLFSDDDWARHESSWRFVLEPRMVYRVCVALAVPLLQCLVVAALCALYEGLRPSHFRSLKDLELAFEYSLISLPLSLLLVFKTNTSYSRFWEGVLLL